MSNRTILTMAALALFAGLTLVQPAANAQTVSLDNVPAFSLSTSTTTSAVSIDPASGNVIVRSAVGNLSSCTSTAPNPPSITGFTSNLATVSPSTTFRLTWSSTNTTSCSPQLGGTTIWSSLGTLPTNGFQDLTAPATAQTITFQLTCTNGSQNVNQQTSVTVSSGGGGGNCTPPAGNIVIGPTAWNNLFATPWPSYNGVSRQCVSNGNIASFEFNATSLPNQFGTISTSRFPGDGDGLGRVSISTTPGCFDGNVLTTPCLGPLAELPGVSWTNGSSAFACNLTPGQRYYVNLYFPNCSAGTCCRDFGNIQQLLESTQPAK
jgi:hypothetical protein